MNEVKRTVFNLAADNLPSVSEIGSVEIHHKLADDTIHTHGDAMEIIYCRRGSHIYESLGREYLLTPGRLFISRPREPHCISSQSKWLATYYMVVRLPRTSDDEFRLSAAEAKWLRQGFTALPDRLLEASPAIPLLFRSVLDACMVLPVGNPERALRLHLGILNLLYEVLRCSRDEAKRGSSTRIETFIDEMRAHPERAYPEELLQEQCAMSSSKLNTAFKKCTGLPPHAFLISCRIAKAKEMLLDARIPIAAISDRLGFTSSKYFANVFHQLVGCAPSAFRTAALDDLVH